MASKRKKIVRIIGYSLLTLIVAGVVGCVALDRPLPEGVSGEKAEALADQMLSFVDQEAWQQTAVVGFTFRGNHHYVWDKARQLTEVKWDNVRVLMDLQTREGKVWEGGELLGQEAAAEPLQTAWEYWCNDTFWLNPVVKIRDVGTSREYIPLEGPQEGLLVTFSSGGVTPGDSYLWYVNPDGEPTHWRMWVRVIPIGGIQVPWENWKTLHTGAKVALSHGGNALLGVQMGNVRSADSVEELVGTDIFEPLKNRL